MGGRRPGSPAGRALHWAHRCRGRWARPRPSLDPTAGRAGQAGGHCRRLPARSRLRRWCGTAAARREPP
eukprot:6375687-Alexandrium_andersonii.AAC.1